MPAAAIILPLAESFGLGALGVTAGGIGAAITGLEAETVIASTIGGAIIGAGEGALNAAISGGDIGKGALGGFVSGGVGTAVTSGVQNILGTGQPIGGTIGPQQPTGFQSAAERGLASLAGGTAGGIATGRTPEAAFRASIPGAVGGALSGAAQYGLGLDSSTSGLLGQGTSTALRYATTPSPSVPSYTPPVQPGLSLQGPLPSPTLGQSLSIAPSLGYTPSGSVFGSSDSEGKKSNVWNVGSLRNVGAAEA
jgi:hypothetical protein